MYTKKLDECEHCPALEQHNCEWKTFGLSKEAEKLTVQSNRWASVSYALLFGWMNKMNAILLQGKRKTFSLFISLDYLNK